MLHCDVVATWSLAVSYAPVAMHTVFRMCESRLARPHRRIPARSPSHVAAAGTRRYPRTRTPRRVARVGVCCMAGRYAYAACRRLRHADRASVESLCSLSAAHCTARYPGAVNPLDGVVKQCPDDSGMCDRRPHLLPRVASSRVAICAIASRAARRIFRRCMLQACVLHAACCKMCVACDTWYVACCCMLLACHVACCACTLALPMR